LIGKRVNLDLIISLRSMSGLADGGTGSQHLAQRVQTVSLCAPAANPDGSYTWLGAAEVVAIMSLLRISNNRALGLLEQAIGSTTLSCQNPGRMFGASSQELSALGAGSKVDVMRLQAHSLGLLWLCDRDVLGRFATSRPMLEDKHRQSVCLA